MTPISNTLIIYATKKAGTKVSAFADNHLVPAVVRIRSSSVPKNPKPNYILIKTLLFIVFDQRFR